MSEKIQTPPTTDHAEAASASRRLFAHLNSKAIAISAGAALLLGGAVASNIENNIHNDERKSSVIEDYQKDQAVTAEIGEKALEPAVKANIVGLFDITPGTTVNESSFAIVQTLDAFGAADKQTKDFITFTVLESGNAMGSYDLGDTFAVSRATIDGRDTFIVQDGTGVEEATIPSPITH